MKYLIPAAIIFFSFLIVQADEQQTKDPEQRFIQRFIRMANVNKTKGENFDITPYLPVTDNLENNIKFIDTVNRKYSQEKPNFIIFPEDIQIKTGARIMPYVLQWNENKKEYEKKYSITPGKNYYVIYDNRRLNNVSICTPKSKNCDTTSTSSPEDFTEKKIVELQYGWNGEMQRRHNTDVIWNFQSGYNTLYLEKIDHAKGKNPEQEYVEVQFPMINIPVKNVFINSNGETLKEEPVMFIHLRAISLGQNLKNPALGIDDASYTAGDPSSGVSAWCLPADGYTLDHCGQLGHVPAAIGIGVENYPRNK